MTPPPPKLMSVSEVVAYLAKKYNHNVSRQMIYLYMNNGLRNETLEYTTLPALSPRGLSLTRRITRRAIDSFCDRTGISDGRNRRANLDSIPEAGGGKQYSDGVEQRGIETTDTASEPKEFVEDLESVPEGR